MKTMIAAMCVMCVGMATMAAASSQVQSALSSGIDKSNVDTSIRPQDDFFHYVNGTWLKTAEIPADRTTTGTMWDLREKAREDVLVIIKEAAAKKDLAPGSDEQKVALLYNSFMDTETVNKLGMKPLKAELDAIEGLADKTGISAYLAHSQKIGGGGPFVLYINTDGKDSTRYAAHMWQSGIGLPDRDYYFNEDERSVALREAYVAHIQKMFELAGFAEPGKSSRMLMEMETKIAKVSWTNVENRNRDKTYNKIEIAELGSLGEGIDWAAFFKAAGASSEKSIIINQPTFIRGFNEIFSATSVADLKIFLKWNLLNSFSGYLGSEIDQQNFEFYNKTLMGQAEQKPRWKRAVSAVNGSLGEVIGKVYVSRHFTPEAKIRMLELVENLRGAYGAAIKGLEWMSEDTKAKALVKLAKFRPKVGYPDQWEDYSKLEIKSGDLIGNIIRSNEFQYELEHDKLGGPILEHEWGMTPQTVNAYYNPGMNEIVFPAAILQPPFFNIEADDAANYGAIGAVIGHEMGHGFDDQGSKYDSEGNLNNWWTDNDLKEFRQRTSTLVDQYSAFQVFDDLNVNGELTLGENIGDLAGLTIAFRAYQISLDGEDAPIIDEMTGAQRFFMGIGQVWRYKATEETSRNRVATDSHSPAQFRVFGPLRNMPEFHAAFDVKEGDGMYLPPEERVKIW